MLNKMKEIEEHIQILKIKTYESHSQSSPIKGKGSFSQKSFSSTVSFLINSSEPILMRYNK